MTSITTVQPIIDSSINCSSSKDRKDRKPAVQVIMEEVQDAVRTWVTRNASCSSSGNLTPGVIEGFFAENFLIGRTITTQSKEQFIKIQERVQEIYTNICAHTRTLEATLQKIVNKSRETLEQSAKFGHTSEKYQALEKKYQAVQTINEKLQRIAALYSMIPAHLNRQRCAVLHDLGGLEENA